MKEYNKLIRDKIPEYIASQGGKSETRTLEDAEYRSELYKKLLEESQELVEKQGGDKQEVINEIADVLEVLEAIMKLEGLSQQEVVDRQQQKREERGSFDKKIFLIRS
ncbi:MAG: nucleoside triphosphate pyrophosphohydrolase [Patescibacteria group bacterium]|jgi:predicted house-cleaning noncanonical NTP pyrophosphatase (MazG superfamily)